MRLTAVSTWQRYLLFQVPGWIITGVILLGLWNWQYLPGWLAVICLVGWVLKDLTLYPLLRRGYELPAKNGVRALVGTRGVARDDLAPHGYVRVRGELWSAVVSPADRVINSGTEVEIVDAEGMKVFVRAVNTDQKR